LARAMVSLASRTPSTTRTFVRCIAYMLRIAR